ncbi:MAG: tetratricopeptide repeat protein [Sneathiella sp.]
MNIKILMTTAIACMTLPSLALSAGQSPKNATTQITSQQIMQDKVSDEIRSLQTQWARIKYQTPDKAIQIEKIHKLEVSAAAVSNTHPNSAEPKIWEAIILATDAGIDSGFSALSKIKKARELLEDALKIDANALNGSAHTSLGSLYYQVPGWPISFGNDNEARKHLKKALAINPDGIDPNYFYGDFLYQDEKFDDAKEYLEKALKAPSRNGRKLADEGRRQEIRAALAKLRDTSRLKQHLENASQ